MGGPLSEPATGYDPLFLGPVVPLPVLPADVEVRRLDSTHFTLLHRADRRLAEVTAVVVDGAALVDVPRSDDWRPDPRVPVEDQLTGPYYAGNDLDRGHLVRRRDPAWGGPVEARRGSDDTFVYTNAAPQAARFNQGMDLWVGLEDHVLAFARADRRRIAVMTAPVLEPDDPTYRGAQVPRRFWKVAAWADDGVLGSAAFVLDQAALLRPILAGDDAGVREAAALGGFRTFQVPVVDVERLTGLGLGPLVEADALPVVVPRELPAPGEPAPPSWVRLRATGDVLL